MWLRRDLNSRLRVEGLEFKSRLSHIFQRGLFLCQKIILMLVNLLYIVN